MSIENNLRQLQTISPSKKLVNRIAEMTDDLPVKSHGFNISLMAFRVALAAMVLFLLSSMGTGVLLAARGSSEGSIFFPIKQTLEKHSVPFFAPPISPTVALQKSITPSSEEKETDTEKEKTATDSGTSIHRGIKKVGEDEKELEDHILIPTEAVEGIHISPKKEDDK